MVAGLLPEQGAEFSLQSSYFKLGCQDGRIFNVDDQPSSGERRYLGGLTEYLGTLGFRSNMSAGFSAGVPPNTNQTRWNSFFVDTSWQYMTDTRSLSAPGNISLIYVSIGDGLGPISAFNCSISTSRVESDIICAGKSCHVNRMRHSRQDTQPSHLTPFNTGNFVYFDSFLRYFPWAAGVTHASFISPTDLYMAGSDWPFAPN
jgi:hypothetical protein